MLLFFIHFPKRGRPTHFQMIHKCNNKPNSIFYYSVYGVCHFIYEDLGIRLVVSLNSRVPCLFIFNLKITFKRKLVLLLALLLDYELLVFHEKSGSLGSEK